MAKEKLFDLNWLFGGLSTSVNPPRCKLPDNDEIIDLNWLFVDLPASLDPPRRKLVADDAIIDLNCRVMDPSASATCLLDLNEDCLIAIFTHLSIDDLLSAADTCTHFRAITRSAVPKTFYTSTVFERHRSHSIYVLKKYLQYFGDSIQHIYYNYPANCTYFRCFTFDTRFYSYDPILETIIMCCGTTLQSLELDTNFTKYPFVRTSDEFLCDGGLFKSLKNLKIIENKANGRKREDYFEVELDATYEGNIKATISKRIMCPLKNRKQKNEHFFSELNELIDGHFGLTRIRVAVPDFEPLLIKRNGENNCLDLDNHHRISQYLYQYRSHFKLIYTFECDRNELIHTLIANSSFALETIDLLSTPMHLFRVIDAFQYCFRLRVLKLNESTRTCLYDNEQCFCYTEERLEILLSLIGLQEIELQSDFNETDVGKHCIYQFINRLGCIDSLRVLRIRNNFNDRELFESISRFHRLRVLTLKCNLQNHIEHLALLDNLHDLEEIGVYEMNDGMPLTLIGIFQTVKLLPKIEIIKTLYSRDAVHNMDVYRNLIKWSNQQYRKLTVIYCNDGNYEGTLDLSSIPKTCDLIEFRVKSGESFWSEDIS